MEELYELIDSLYGEEKFSPSVYSILNNAIMKADENYITKDQHKEDVIKAFDKGYDNALNNTGYLDEGKGGWSIADGQDHYNKTHLK